MQEIFRRLYCLGWIVLVGCALWAWRVGALDAQLGVAGALFVVITLPVQWVLTGVVNPAWLFVRKPARPSRPEVVVAPHAGTNPTTEALDAYRVAPLPVSTTSTLLPLPRVAAALAASAAAFFGLGYWSRLPIESALFSAPAAAPDQYVPPKQLLDAFLLVERESRDPAQIALVNCMLGRRVARIPNTNWPMPSRPECLQLVKRAGLPPSAVAPRRGE